MIVKYFLDFITTVWTSLMGAIPDVPVPDWLTGSGSDLHVLFAEAGSMGVWFNLPLALTVGGVILACLAMSAAVKIARIVLSFATAGGGSAG